MKREIIWSFGSEGEMGTAPSRPHKMVNPPMDWGKDGSRTTQTRTAIVLSNYILTEKKEP